MFEHIWSVLCERVSIDQDTNLASYLTAVEGINAMQLPITVQNLSLGTRWHKEEDSEAHLSIRLFLVAPDGMEEKLVDGVQSTTSRNHRVNFILNGLVFKKIGRYVLKLQVKNDERWTTVHEIPLEITISAPSAHPQQPRPNAGGIKEKKSVYKR